MPRKPKTLPRKDKVLFVHIDAAAYERLRAAALAEAQTISEFTRRAVVAAVVAHEKKNAK